jgi:hypothetical protein
MGFPDAMQSSKLNPAHSKNKHNKNPQPCQPRTPQGPPVRQKYTGALKQAWPCVNRVHNFELAPHQEHDDEDDNTP